MIDWIADYHERVETLPVLAASPASARRAAAAPPAPGEASTRAARPRRADPARHHALAASVLLRLLPGQRQRAGDPRRPAGVRARRAGHALVDLAGRDRARDPRAGLAARAARPARAASARTGRAAASSSTPPRTPRWSRCWPRCTAPAAARPSARAWRRARYTVYTSAQTHSSVEKACRIAGLGAGALRKIDVDPATRRPGPHLRTLIEADVAAGFTPALVVASVGATGTGAVDPLRELAEIAHEHGAWLHVDAAWAGVAAVCPEFRWINDGVEQADSYCTNPHKWLLTNFDCSAFWVADRAALVGALSILPEYLRNAATESGAVIDYRDWQVPLGRRFRALKLWAVIRWYGVEGLQAHIRAHVGLAAGVRVWVRGDERFELLAPHPLALVTFRLRAGDDATLALMRTVNESGALYLTHTSVNGQQALRLAIGGARTERQHVKAAWTALAAAAG